MLVKTSLYIPQIPRIYNSHTTQFLVALSKYAIYTFPLNHM